MAEKKITIVEMNDFHGYLEEHWEHFWDGGRPQYIRAGGLARIARYLKDIRRERKDAVLFLDGGDTFHGTYPVVKTRGEACIPLLRELGIAAMTAHWEFAYGLQRFKEIVKDLNYPMLAINCYSRETGDLVFPPYLIKVVNGMKVAVIGIAATIVDKVMPDHYSEGIYFTLGNEELPHYIEKVRKEEQADLVVIISHLGFPQELKLAGEVDGIDILLSAHTHNRVYEPAKVNETIIIQSGCHGSFLGRLDVSVEDKKVKEYRHELVVLDETIPEDEQMKALVDKTLAPYREKLNRVLGRTRTGLNRNLVLESTMDNLLLKSLSDYTGAGLAFSNGWRYGAPIPPGDITENDLWNIIPVNPPISRVKITGRELEEMMEENLERTFARDPYEQMGGYVKRCLGINLYFKIENPFGERIQTFFIQGRLLEKDRTYDAVFVTAQGVPAKYGHDREKLDVNAIDTLKKYIKKNKTVSAPLTGTIVAV